MKTLFLAAAAAAFVALSPVGASAAPINATPLAAAEDAGVTLAHYWGGGGRGYGWNRGYQRNYGWQRHHHRHHGWAQPRFRAYYY